MQTEAHHAILRHQHFIARAEEQRDRFPDTIIARVTGRHRAAIAALEAQARDEHDALRAERARLRAACDSAQQATCAAEGALEEQRLRAAIGEVPESAVDSTARQQALERHEQLSGELEAVEQLLSAWTPDELELEPDAERQAVLIFEEGTLDERLYPVRCESLQIGRARDNDLQIRGDSQVSRVHGKLYRDGARYIFTDLGSANGSVVNGEPVRCPRPLLGGEEIMLGTTVLRFRLLA